MQGSFPRIASFRNPMRKMSKSDRAKASKVLLTTPPEEVRSIIARAVTDSIDGVYASPDRPGVTNLLQILAAFRGASISDVEAEVRNCSMREFKDKVSEAVTKELVSIQARYKEVWGNRDWLEEMRKLGNARAREIASERMVEIKKTIGLL